MKINNFETFFNRYNKKLLRTKYSLKIKYK